MAYIDKELFKQDIKMRYCNNCARPSEIKCRACHVDDMLGDIEYAHTADVAEVKHGYWKYYSTTMMECSVCKRHTPRHRYVFCPHCGAKMRGDTE